MRRVVAWAWDRLADFAIPTGAVRLPRNVLHPDDPARHPGR